MDTPIWLQIVEITVAIAGLAYGIYESNQRQRLSNVLRTILRSFPGDVAKMEQSCDWGWNNVRSALKEVAKIPDGEEKRKIIESLGLAMGDTRSGINSCVQLFNSLLTFQEAQFSTRDITHPQRNSLGLYKAELSSRTAPPQPEPDQIA